MKQKPSQRAKDISKEICDSYNASLPLRGLAIVIQAALDAERAELEGIAKGLEDVTIRKDKRIEAMAALLDRVPHMQGVDAHPGEALTCEDDCPACAWARLKAQP